MVPSGTYAGIAQLVEYLPSKQKVVGSNPISRQYKQLKNTKDE